MTRPMGTPPKTCSRASQGRAYEHKEVSLLRRCAFRAAKRAPMEQSFRIPLPPHCNVNRMLAFLRTSALRSPYLVSGPRRLGRLVQWHQRPIVLEFDFPTDTREVGVTVDTTGKVRSTSAQTPRGADLRQLASLLWGLNDDLTKCYADLRLDPSLVPLLRANRGLRLMRNPDIYEALVMGVIGQQLSVASAAAIRHRLIMTVGERVVVHGREYRGYPSPRRLLAAGGPALREVGMSRPKVRYIQKIAELAATGGLDRDAFDGLDDETAIAQLMEIPGVGRWTAEIALMRGLGRPDVFPAGDLGLTVATQRLLRMRARPKERQLRTLAARWKGWRSYVALYLWASLAAGG